MKSKAPLNYASAESRGLILDGWRRFKVRVDWERRRSQRFSGKSGSQLVITAIRWSLKVCMARSAEFFLVQVGGYKLKCDSLVAHIILESSWAFIVEHLELARRPRLVSLEWRTA